MVRNNALLPGSILDSLAQAARERGFKVVAVIKKGAFDELKERIRNQFGDCVVVENCEEFLHRNILQRITHFFYSYLIFTGTTKLVSSYNVRSDRARPLLSYWNQPFKLLIYKVFGGSRWVKEYITPRFYLLAFNKRPYKYLFEKHHPDLVFLTTPFNWPFDLELLAEAKRFGVKTAGIPGNWDHLSKYYIPFKVDKLLVWSELIKDEAIRHQNYKDEQIKIVGAPQIDFYLRKDTVGPRDLFLRSLGFQTSVRFVTYFSQGPYTPDGADYVDMVIKWIEEGILDKNLRIVVRPHPQGLWEAEKYARFEGHPLVHIDRVDGWSTAENVRSYINLLKHSDIVITHYSTVAVEASIFDRPAIIAGFDGYKIRPTYQSLRRHKILTHFQYLIPLGGVRVTESPDELLKTLQEYLKNPRLDSSNREKLKYKVFGHLDGQNTQRVVDEIISMLD